MENRRTACASHRIAYKRNQIGFILFRIPNHYSIQIPSARHFATNADESIVISGRRVPPHRQTPSNSRIKSNISAFDIEMSRKARAPIFLKIRIKYRSMHNTHEWFHWARYYTYMLALLRRASYRLIEKHIKWAKKRKKIPSVDDDVERSTNGYALCATIHAFVRWCRISHMKWSECDVMFSVVIMFCVGRAIRTHLTTTNFEQISYFTNDFTEWTHLVDIFMGPLYVVRVLQMYLLKSVSFDYIISTVFLLLLVSTLEFVIIIMEFDVSCRKKNRIAEQSETGH